jgi:hypothetical protein
VLAALFLVVLPRQLERNRFDADCRSQAGKPVTVAGGRYCIRDGHVIS